MLKFQKLSTVALMLASVLSANAFADAQTEAKPEAAKAEATEMKAAEVKKAGSFNDEASYAVGVLFGSDLQGLIDAQIEKRIAYKKAMTQAISRSMKSPEVKGIKVMISGRLNGAEIARSEWAVEGKVPLHTLRADIDYAVATAHTTYGALGIKVWIFHGEVLPSKKEGGEA